MNKENVIKGMETIKQFFGYGLPSTAEMFDSYYGILNDAIDLLKEQEAVKPTWGRGKPYCGACGSKIRGKKYCSECGKPIAWEDR